MTKEDIRAKIIAKAWKDPAFKKKLLSNPKAALKEMGIAIPDNVSIRAIEDDPHTLTFILPPTPVKLNQLSDAELRKLAAAGGAQGEGTLWDSTCWFCLQK